LWEEEPRDPVHLEQNPQSATPIIQKLLDM
jgi:hypothetical protein